MNIDTLRTDLLIDALKDAGRSQSVRYALAPCQPEEDYDRFERWSNGFNHRASGRQLGTAIGWAVDFVAGWTACDRLLCPEKYQGELTL